MNAVEFLKEFIRHPQWTGTFFASTEPMAHAITEVAGLARADSIVELGPGDGVFTKAIVAKKKPTADFFALETNPFFVEATRQACPGVEVYEDSAENIAKYLKQRGRTSTDVIVSALPWAAFSEEMQKRIFSAVIDSLRPGGTFVTIAYVTGRPMPAGRRFEKLLRSRLVDVTKSPIVWRNRPPAIVYSGRKAR